MKEICTRAIHEPYAGLLCGAYSGRGVNMGNVALLLALVGGAIGELCGMPTL